MKVFSEVKAKHHFEIGDQKIYTLECSHVETLMEKFQACLKIAFEFYKAEEEEKEKDAKEAQKATEKVKVEKEKVIKDCEEYVQESCEYEDVIEKPTPRKFP